MNEREEHNRLKCCERCGEPPALCGCWSTDNDLIGRLRQQLAEKEQDFQVVKLAVIETEGRCAEFKAMLDDTLKQEFAVRQQLAEARAEVERVRNRGEVEKAAVILTGNRILNHEILKHNEQLAAQAAELERLRGMSEEHKFQLGLARGLLARSQRAFKLVNAAFLHGARPDESTAEGDRQIEAIVELHDCSTDIAHYWYSHVQRESDHACGAQTTTDNPSIP